MAKDLYYNIIILISLFLDLASSLYISQESMVRKVGDTFVVICKDKDRGRQVTWKDPNNARLGLKTHPRVETTSFGTNLIFKNAREEDSGDYKCSTSGLSPEENTFSLQVTVITTTDTDNEPITVKPIIYEDENEPTPAATETINNNNYHTTDTDPPDEEENVLKTSTTEEIIVITTAEETTDIPSTTTITIEPVLKRIETPHFVKATIQPRRNNTKYGNKRPELVFKDTPNRQEIVEGQNGFLRCEVNKNAVITWFHGNPEATENSENVVNNDTKFQKLGDGLLIRNVARGDAGVYTCQAIHQSSGFLINQNITVIVQHKPIVVREKQEVVYGFLNEQVNLTCEVEAVPSPKFNWTMRLGGKIIDMSSYVVEESSHRSVLQLNLTSNHSNAASYKCRSKNTQGHLDIDFVVQTVPQPDPPIHLNLTDSTSDSLQLEITIPEPSKELTDVGMQPKFLVVEYRNQSEEEWHSEEIRITDLTCCTVRVLLTELNKNTTYEVQAATKNPGGLSTYVLGFFTTSTAPTSVHSTLPIFSLVLASLSILMYSGTREA